MIRLITKFFVLALLTLSLFSQAQTPVFKLRFQSEAVMLPAGSLPGGQKIQVYIDADRDVPDNKTFPITLRLCPGTPAPTCSIATTANWYFTGYPEIGVAGTEQITDQSVVKTFTFNFQKGKNTQPINPRSMGVGYIYVQNSPYFFGTNTVALGLSGKNVGAAVYKQVAITSPAGFSVVDLDINGSPLPTYSATKDQITAAYNAGTLCEFPGGTPVPGLGGGPCGSSPVPVTSATDSDVNCNSGMTTGNTITNAWQFNMDYNFGAITSHRLGMQPRHVLSYRFKTPTVAESEAAGIGNFLPHVGTFATQEQSNRGSPPAFFVTVSEKRCKFDYAALTTPSNPLYNCAKSSNTPSISLDFKILTSDNATPAAGVCNLKPGRYYYVNIRMENASGNPGLTGCTLISPATTCGFTSQLN